MLRDDFLALLILDVFGPKHNLEEDFISHNKKITKKFDSPKKCANVSL